MKIHHCIIPALVILSVVMLPAKQDFLTDTLPTTAGDLSITFLGHGTLMFAFNDKVVYVDPVARVADFSDMAPADVILITHHHGDHLDPASIRQLQKEHTRVILTATCAERFAGGTVMANGADQVVHGLPVTAVPAYNLVHKRDSGQLFHPPDEGNGYVITFGDLRVYVAGDTENTPEMKALEGIDVAFLPMNLPYTMTPEMVADAARAIQPKVLYPYHYGNTDTAEIVVLLKDQAGIEVRIRALQ